MGCTAEPKSCWNPGKRERKSARAAARLRLRLEDLDAQSGLRQHDGGGQTVWTCSDNNGSSLVARHRKFSVCEWPAIGQRSITETQRHR